MSIQDLGKGLGVADFVEQSGQETSHDVAARVLAARDRQTRRYRLAGFSEETTNASVDGEALMRLLQIADKARTLLSGPHSAFIYRRARITGCSKYRKR